MNLTDTQNRSVAELADRVRAHFDGVAQDVPDQSFLVGGAVRDALLGIESQDLDFVVVGETPESMQERGFDPIEASSFPVFHDSDHQEWALARTEEKSGEGYTGFEVFTDDVSLREDLERRDLTMNAMALDTRNAVEMYNAGLSFTDAGEGWGLIDPHDGVEDIENGVLRHVSDAFAEDPLRVLRVARYAGRFAVPTDEELYERVENPDSSVSENLHQFATHWGNWIESGFAVDGNIVKGGAEAADHQTTIEMMRQCAPELNRMSRDRIGTELRKAMAQARRPSRVFEVLRDCGALAVIWPELDRGASIQAGPPEHHAEGSVLDHTLMCIDRMDRLCRERSIDGHDRVRRLFAILGHDIGKVIVHDR